MSDIPLPLDRFSAESYHTALDDLVQRYWNKQEPVHYKEASINLSQSTCSSCLKYLSAIDLIEVEKAGVYIPTEEAANYIRTEGVAKSEAVGDLEQLLESYPVYSEAKFLIKQGSYDEEELAVKIARQLDIDENSTSKVQTAISIFREFGLLEADENGNLSINSGNFESSGNVTEKDDREKQKQPFQGNVEDIVNIDDIELPPGRGDPEKLIELVDFLSSGGSHTKSKISEESPLSDSSINGVLKYGERLNFIEETEDGYKLTKKGFDLPFVSGENERQKLFREAILSYDVYCALIFQMADRYLTNGEKLNTPNTLREMRTTFKFRDVSEDRLKRSITTLFRSLAQAGIGNYVQGRGNKPTRLEVEQHELEKIRDEIILDRRPEQQTIEENPSQRTLGDSKNQTESTEETESEDQKETESPDQEETNTETDQEEEENIHRGPSLRISKFRIQNFRNVRDTGMIGLENVTTLIGKNESGKTSTLEAIAYFSEDRPLDNRDISNEIDISDTNLGNLPIVTLEFLLNEEAIKTHYSESLEISDADLPLKITQTKYADGSYDRSISAQVDQIELPAPEILYYKDYSTISDEATLDEIRGGNNNTFQNLIKISGLDLEALERDGLEKYNAIQSAEDEIETKLNSAWSQKDIEVDLRWNDSSETINLLIKDQIDQKGPGSDRTLTYPSQRSEGFQWFFSFYVNLLAETENSVKHTKILLLDDPAVKLHPEGKQDWLESVNEIGEEQQIVFSSHSPYLIDKNYPSRVRAVEDTPNNGTRIKQDIFGADDDTLEPLRNALGVDLGSSPFVSGRQVLVEGPTEYYVVTAVANYLHNVLDRDIFDWPGISVMPVRGAPDVIGKASWLASEGINYAILLDSDSEGQEVEEKIENHHEDIDDERVVLLRKGAVEGGLVIEDMFAPELYISAFNTEYEDYTSELEAEFEPAEIEQDGHRSWQIGDLEYEGTDLPNVLEDYLSQQPVSEELSNADGEIELRKRQIAERIASKLNNAKVDDSHLDAFNPLFGDIGSALNTGDRR